MKDLKLYSIYNTESIHEALKRLNELSGDVQTLFILQENGIMYGTLTDGDLRRALLNGCKLEDAVSNAANTNFKFIENAKSLPKEIKSYRDLGIKLLPCLDKNKKLINLYDLTSRINVLPLDAVLMAGGKGERLKPLTDKTPKPLLKVGNKSIIDYNIDSLYTSGIDNYFITVNYLAEQLELHFNEKYAHLKAKCVREPHFMGTIGALSLIDSFSSDYVLIMNSDLFTNIDFEDFFFYFQDQNADMLAAAIPHNVSIPYGIFNTQGDVIHSIDEKPNFEFFANAGIYIVKRELLSLIPKNTFMNATDFMQLLINKGKKVIKYPIIGYWIDIGRPDEYKRVLELAKHITAR